MNSDNLHNTFSGLGPRLQRLPGRVRKPSRYIGGEVNAVRKEDVEVRFALAFPDVYDVGMSHLGMRILYSIINAAPYAAAERFFCPWPDMESFLRESREPLRSLETGKPLHEFDVVGFSLQYELCASGVLQILDLGGIPLLSAQRKDGDPVVIAGGPVAYNPAPLSSVIDAFALGDGEDLVMDVTDAVREWKRRKSGRRDLLERLKDIDGVYVPALHREPARVRRRVCADLEHAPFPTAQIVPYCEPVHDRIGLEIARGCTRGCRFCQAGFLYRPVRERSVGRLMELAEANLRSTGWEEISLLSLSAGDHSQIGEIVAALAARFSGEKTAISLPSLRTESLDQRIADEIKRVRKTGFTLAPEAGTDRLRRVINKGNDEADLERAVRAAFHTGWQTLKLYFMIGLPTETEEDVIGLADLIRKAARWAGKNRLTVSISTFVPKTHTPFQWAAQDTPEVTLAKQRMIIDRVRPAKVRVRCHDSRLSFLEGVIARGDARVGEAVVEAYRRGARFDGWNELLDFDLWMDAFRAVGVDPGGYLSERDPSEPLPWRVVETGVSDAYLLRERQNALDEVFTPDCRLEGCGDCGVCDFDSVRPMIAKNAPRTDPADAGEAAPQAPDAHPRRFRMRYAKSGLMRFLGHRDVMRAIHRAFRRSGVKLAYSQGFHPHPKLVFAPPPPVGVESRAEYLDFDLVSPPEDASQVFAELKRTMPAGLDPLEVESLSPARKSISKSLRGFCYEVTPAGIQDASRVQPDGRRPLDSALSDQHAGADRGRKAITAEELSKCVEKKLIRDNILYFVLKWDQNGCVNPLDAAAAILGVEPDVIREMKVVKVQAIFEQ
jgi:radical SAM family uncharacterized protein/radical SAM-linked protein